MYLAILNREEKELFLNLAYELASIDGDYSDEENAMINGYCHEMQIVFEKEKMVKSIEKLLTRISEISDERAKKIIVFEIIGLAMADGKFDEDERKLVTRMEVEFKLGAEYAMKCEAILEEYIAFQNKINQHVLDKGEKGCLSF